MTKIEMLADILTEVVSGNLTHLTLLIATTHEKLRKARELLSSLLLTQTSVLQVLYGLKTGTLMPDMVQIWASFMIRGYFASNSKTPISPIDIEYDQSAEDSIADVLSRLDQLGDVTDGSIDEEELEDLISLDACESNQPFEYTHMGLVGSTGLT